MSLKVSDELAAREPGFAAICDNFNVLKDAFDMQSRLVENLTMQRDILARAVSELTAQNDALRAILNAKKEGS